MQEGGLKVPKVHAIAALAIMGLTVGCTAPVRYQEQSVSDFQTIQHPAENRIEYVVNPRSYLYDGYCTVVMPLHISGGQASPAIAWLIETAAARALSGHVSTVVDPSQRHRQAHRQGIDLADREEGRHFRRAIDCPAFLTIDLISWKDRIALVAAEKTIALRLRLEHGDEAEPLWQAQTGVTRRAGGLPLSILGAGVAVVEAATFHQDHEQIASVVDDAMRRLFRTLPDFR